MSLPRSSLSLLLAAFLVGAWGCASGAASSAKTKAGPPHGAPGEAEASAQPGGSGYAAKVRAALTAKHEEAAACFAKTGGARRPVSVMVSSPLYISPGAAYFPKHAAAPFMAAFERCLLAALERWPLPRPISGYEGAWLRIHLQPLEASVPETHSVFFEQEGTRALLEVSGGEQYAEPRGIPVPAPAPGEVPTYDASAMTRPRELSGNRIRYSDEAYALRVQGVMVVRCTITDTGVVENCRILKPLPYMERNALLSLYSKRYTPVLFGGKPVNIDYTFTIQLRLPDGGMRRR